MGTWLCLLSINPIEGYAPHAKHAPEEVVDRLEPLHPILRVELENFGL
jgi:hypothetical protein